MIRSGHRDSFARDNLPPPEDWPRLLLERPGYPWTERVNCASWLLHRALDAGHAERTALLSPRQTLSYAELEAASNRIASALTRELGLVSGNRVLLRGPNNPMFVACWLGVVKAGGVAVATMPLLRAGELRTVMDATKVSLALCDERWLDELERAADDMAGAVRVVCFDGANGDGAELESLAVHHGAQFEAVDTAADDVALIAFTSGTTGKPKGTMHFHRDVLAICNGLPTHCLRPTPADRFIGSPPLAFTFGLGGLALFPLYAGATAVLLEQAGPFELAAAIERYQATVCFTAPTAYRALLANPAGLRLESLRCSVSAGETLPAQTFEDWRDLTGLSSVDSLGSTEMLHAFVASPPEHMRAGFTGQVLPGYEARVVDEHMRDVSPGETGRLAVRGPTGCRYLNDARQREYVRDGWNLTGDTYALDGEGYFRYVARTDDMIISAGYNIAGPEVEDALLTHPSVHECAVVGVADDRRGQIPKAFVVLREGISGDAALSVALQEHVKARIAPYKYPRAIAYKASLPRTETGKVARFKLRGATDAGEVT